VLYRRWPQRRDLLLATLKRVWRSQAIEVPDTGSLRGDALAFLRNADAAGVRMRTLIHAQVAEFFREAGTDFRELRASLHAPGEVPPFEQIVARAVARGELADLPRSTRVVNLPLDLFRHEVFMTLRPVAEATLVELVDGLWLPLLRAGAPGPTRGGRPPR
jgi:hypothetical protein